jgi:ABC-type Fe3+/spermidine/putrescine transport system ATPase subunit
MNTIGKPVKVGAAAAVQPRPSASAPVVEIRNLVKRFGSVAAANNVSLTLEAGKTLVLLGESGSGKTTVLRCVAGLENASSGTIMLSGTVVDDGQRTVPPESRRIGMVFQSYALWPQMTALENVTFAGTREQRGSAARKAARRQGEQLLDSVGLAGMKDRLPSQLSGGQQQRVALARALAGDVRLLLMDEPLSALDQALREELRLGLRAQIQKSGLACLYVTHDQEEALAMADELIVMRSGVVEERGDPRAIYERPATAFGAGFLGAKNVARGRVVKTGTPLCVAEVAGQMIAFSPVDSVVVGDEVELRWRREHMRFSEGGEPTNRWPAQVTSAVYLGHRWEVGLNCLGVAMRAWSENELAGAVPVQVSPMLILGYALRKTSAGNPADTSPSSLRADPGPVSAQRNSAST